MDEKERRASVRDLWRTCFDDSEAFMDLYFGRKYTDESNLYREEEGRVVSALQYFCYPFRWGGGPVVRRAAYLSGIATLPEWRGRGLAAGLVREAHRRLYEKGVLFCALIPAEPSLFEFYRRLGYSTCVYRRMGHLMPPEGSLMRGRVEEVQMVSDELFRCFSRQWGRSGSCVWMLDSNDFDVVVADWRLSGGRVYAVYTHLGLSGVVFVKVEGATGTLYEVSGLRTRVFSFLMTRLRAMWPGVVAWQTLSSGAASDAMPFAQVRVIRAAEALRRYAALHPSESVSLQVFDEDLPENNGYYTLKNGRCYRLQPASGAVHFTPARLSAFLLRKSHPCLGFMLE